MGAVFHPLLAFGRLRIGMAIPRGLRQVALATRCARRLFPLLSVAGRLVLHDVLPDVGRSAGSLHPTALFLGASWTCNLALLSEERVGAVVTDRALRGCLRTAHK